MSPLRRDVLSGQLADCLAENENLQQLLAAAEDKGRSEERERLRSALTETTNWDATTARKWAAWVGARDDDPRFPSLSAFLNHIADRAALASLDSDQEAANA